MNFFVSRLSGCDNDFLWQMLTLLAALYKLKSIMHGVSKQTAASPSKQLSVFNNKSTIWTTKAPTDLRPKNELVFFRRIIYRVAQTSHTIGIAIYSAM